MIAQEKEGPQKLTQHPHNKEYLKYQIKLSNGTWVNWSPIKRGTKTIGWANYHKQ